MAKQNVLEAWLKSVSWGPNDLHRALVQKGSTVSGQTVRNWVKMRTDPSLADAARIVEISGGGVKLEELAQAATARAARA